MSNFRQIKRCAGPSQSSPGARAVMACMLASLLAGCGGDSNTGGGSSSSGGGSSASSGGGSTSSSGGSTSSSGGSTSSSGGSTSSSGGSTSSSGGSTSSSGGSSSGSSSGGSTSSSGGSSSGSSGGSSSGSSSGGTSNVIFFDDFSGTSLGPTWTVISRHGEYSQNETECNIAQQVSVASSLLNITTAVGPAECGDFNVDGSVRHAPASWPYITGDVQWRSLNFTYGTVTVRAKLPAKGTGLWPAIWLLGANCQNTNPYTADVGYNTCPALDSSAYAEIDMVECDLNNWCQLALANYANTGSGGALFPTCGFPVDTQFHVFTLTWTASAITVAVDGQPTGCGYSSPAWTIPDTPMFLIIQTQTGGAGGAPVDALLPAAFQIDYVQVTQP